MTSLKRNFKKLILGALLGAVFVLGLIYHFEKNTSLLQIYFLDIGQGDAIYIRAPNGRDMLVDGGQSALVLRRLREVMPWYDRAIDVVVETHPDADHIGGLPNVLERYRVDMFIEPGIESKNAIDDALRELRAEKGTKDIIGRRGMSVDFGDGAHFDILFPDTDVSEFKDTNDASIVGQLKYGSTTVMLTGDSPKSIEDHLLSLDGAGLKSDILKAGHHGSKTSSGEMYVKTVMPTYVIISAGKDNRYGHPHKEVVDLFEKLGVKMLRTDKEGTIGFISDGVEIKRK